MPRSKRSKETVTSQMKARKRGKKRTSTSGQKLVSCGSTMFDLAMSGSVEGGIAVGKMINIIGDSHAGKSLLSLYVLAEAASDPFFDDYLLIYDDVEAADEFDKPEMFGKRIAKRIVPPPALQKDKTEEGAESDTVEDFEARFNKCIAGDRPFIYVLDSFDALTEVAEQEASEKNSKAHEKGNNAKGTYGTGKAKFASRFLRQAKSKLKQKNSLLVVVSQTRENLNATAFGSKKTRSGGKALKFYATQEVWLACVKTHKDSKYNRSLGTDTRMKVTKSKLTGKVREADTTIFRDYGIDNIYTMIEWLCSVKHWTKSGSTINAKEFDVKLQRKKLISYIEDNDLETELKHIVQDVWDEIEDSLAVNKERKRRYE